MPVNLNHREVRDLAKNLRDLTGREIKHTQILEAIAKAVGRSADSLMHELKNEDATPSSVPAPVVPPDADRMVEGLGFSPSPNGRRGRWVMRVLERKITDPATLDVVIEPTGDLRWLPHLDPAKPMWIVKAVHTAKGWNTMDSDRVVASAGGEGLSLVNAISIAFEFIATRRHLWSNADAVEAEHDLIETNPLAAAELARRAVDDTVGTETPYSRARSLGFDVIADDHGRRFLMDQGPIGKGARYRLSIDNEHPDGLSASPAEEMIWSLSMVFINREGGHSRAPLRLSSNLTLQGVCDMVEHFRRNRYADLADVISTRQNRKKGQVTAVDSKRIAQAAGFEIWDTGGGCKAFAKLLRETATPGGDVATLDVMITMEGGCSVDAPPHERVWGAGLNYTDPRGGDSPLDTGNELHTLEEAIAKAAEFEKQTDRIWADNYDAKAIAEHEGFDPDSLRR